MDTVWPSGVAILFNSKGLEIRKKLHYGKDLAVDVSSIIKEGSNAISIAISQLPPGDTATYYFALERICFTNADSIKSDITTIDFEEARDRILASCGPADPDIEILDPSIILNLTDPFSSSICQTPVRGASCSHKQCFDLDIFLSTRSSKAPTEPCAPDQFRCPICSADARPKSLLLDGFFAKIRDELEHLQRLDAKAVKIDEHGEWKIKGIEETEKPENERVTRKTASFGAVTGSNVNRRESEVIELDDD